MTIGKEHALKTLHAVNDPLTTDEKRHSYPMMSTHSSHVHEKERRSGSFEDAMRLNAPHATPRNKSPKARHKNHRHHHHKHNTSSSSSSSQQKSFPQFNVDNLIPCSDSDSPLHSPQLKTRKKSSESFTNDISQWSYIDPEKLTSKFYQVDIEHRKGNTSCHRFTNGLGSQDGHRKIPFEKSPSNIHTDKTSNPMLHTRLSKLAVSGESEPLKDENNEQIDGTLKLKVKDVYLDHSNTDRKLAMVETLEKHCEDNYANIQRDINTEFANLTTLMQERKNTLLVKAKNIHERKLTSLNESKLKLMAGNQSTSPLDVSFETNNLTTNQLTVLPRTFGESEDTVSNGITEPWRTTDTVDTSSYDKVSNNSNHGNKNNSTGNHNGDHSNDGNHSSKNDNPSDTLKAVSTKTRPRTRTLDEGNMTVSFNSDCRTLMSNFGMIEENLSSAQHSFVTGIPRGILLVGDVVSMRVHTRNVHNEVNVNDLDKIEINVRDCDKQRVIVDYVPMVAEKLEHILHFTETSRDGECKTYSFACVTPGQHVVGVKLNNVDMASSPYTCLVHPKVSPTFENPARDKCMTRRSYSSEESDSLEESFDLHGFDVDWIVQRGGKSSLLRSVQDTPSCIYATEVVKELSAWQLRLTSACSDIVLAIGVATRSGIPEIDEQFVCEFPMLGFNKSNNPDRNLKRRESTFTRLSVTFSVLLNDGCIRVTCDELKVDQKVEVKPTIGRGFSFYPFCSMVHHHDNSISQVCPMPQITFL